MCGVSAIETVTVDSKEEFIFAVSGLTLSFFVMVLNIISPLFNSKN
jgi:hypothetical protein